MLKPRNTNKTGRVTVRRNGKHLIGVSMCGRFMVTLGRFLVIALVVIPFCLEMWMIILLGVLVLLTALFNTLPNWGTMVEAVGFDYDNQNVMVVHHKMKKDVTEVVKPFEAFHFRWQKSFDVFRYNVTWEQSVKFYDLGKKKAVLAFDCLGWEDSQCKRMENELEGFFLE